MASITSANAVFTLIIPGIYPEPQTLQGWSTDDAFDSEPAETGVTRLGVDGLLSAGWVPSTTVVTVHFQADSVSIPVFQTWDTTETTLKEKFPASGIISLPSRSQQWALVNGFLRNVKRMPDARRVLEPVTYTMEWQTITPAPIV